MYIIITIISVVLLFVLFVAACREWLRRKCEPIITLVIFNYLMSQGTMTRHDVQVQLVDGLNHVGIHSQIVHNAMIEATLKQLDVAEATYKGMMAIVEKTFEGLNEAE